MSRTIIVGDLHGCRHELTRLLDHLGWSESDKVYYVGDIASRGPDPLGTLDWVRKTGGRAVLGNHEHVLLRYRDARLARGTLPKLGRGNKPLVGRLRDEDWRWLAALPMWIDLPEHDVRIVHAGVVPGLPMENQPKHVLLSVRFLSPSDVPLDTREPEKGSVLWGARYHGPPHIVFGHYARSQPQIHEWATGLDTGVVYGNRLTAMVLEPGQRVPPVESRGSVLVSIPARAQYYVPRAR
jgi:hypothetical protein